MKIVITHDVDSVQRPLTHVLKRHDRFSYTDLMRHLLGFDNLYDNIDIIMDLEEKYGIKSTWFFPVFLFPLDSIEDKINNLDKGHWEIALHAIVEPR
ncbi:MAG: hypothetical protein DRJ37_01970, partial [Thermoprotei archaeon]